MSHASHILSIIVIIGMSPGCSIDMECDRNVWKKITVKRINEYGRR